MSFLCRSPQQDRRFYEDLIAEVTEIADYYEAELNKAKEVLDLLHGTRFKDLEF